MTNEEFSESDPSVSEIPSQRETKKPRSWWATILTVLLIFLLPTLVYVFLADRFGFHGPRMNADLLLIAILTALIARKARTIATILAVLGITVALAIQIGIGIGTIYIDDPALIREYIGFIAFWPWREIAYWSAFAAVGMFLLYLLLRRVDLAKARILPIAALLLIVSGLDIWGETETGYNYLGDNILTSSGVRLIKLGHQWAASPGFSSEPLTESMMAKKALMETPLPDRMLSVSVEALGLAKNQAYNDAIVTPMKRILAGHYDIEIGDHSAIGGTLSGEMRELCNLRTAGTPTAAVAKELSPNCLPKHLAGLGYKTLGIHGNSRFFYNRQEVYPALGFTDTLFSDSFPMGDLPAPRCKTRAFDGICDSAAFAAALKFIGEAPKRYAHVMTLDTHFPLGTTDLGDESCNRVSGLSNSDLCLYVNQMANLLAELARQLVAADIGPDVIFIFGDHAPPYVTATERAYFERDTVPFIVLRKR